MFPQSMLFWREFCHLVEKFHVASIEASIHPLGPYSVQSVGAAEAVYLAIGHNPGWIATPTQYTSKLALISLGKDIVSWLA